MPCLSVWGSGILWLHTFNTGRFVHPQFVKFVEMVLLWVTSDAHHMLVPVEDTPIVSEHVCVCMCVQTRSLDSGNMTLKHAGWWWPADGDTQCFYSNNSWLLMRLVAACGCCERCPSHDVCIFCCTCICTYTASAQYLSISIQRSATPTALLPNCGHTFI